MGINRTVDMGGSLVAQLLIGFLSPASYVSYNILALICSATLIPTTLTKVIQPKIPTEPRIRSMLAITRSPFLRQA